MRAEVFRVGEYHKVASNWWQQHHGNPISEALLSRFGVVILDGGAPIALGHLYPASTANIVWLGFTVRDPSISSYKAGKALLLLVEKAEQTVRDLGYRVLYTGYDSVALAKMCNKRGYHQGSLVLEQWKVVR